MARRPIQLWLALASTPLVLATACQGSAPTTPAGAQVSGASAKPAASAPLSQPAASKAYAVQAKPFQMPARIWRRGEQGTIPPPEPLPLQRKLMSEIGYPVTTVWESPLFDAALPCDVAFDKDHNAYVPNVEFERGSTGSILKISPAGQVSLFDNRTGNAVSIDKTGTQMAVMSLFFDTSQEPDWERAPMTNLFYTFALPSSAPVLSFAVPRTSDPIPATPVSIGGLTLHTLYDVVHDSAGDILISDGGRNHHAIRKIHPGTGLVTKVAHITNEFFSPATSIAIAPTGVIYAAVGNQLWYIPPGGSPAVLSGAGPQGFTDGPAGVAKFRFPQKLVYGDDGYLYVADQGNCAIRRVSLDGQVTTIAGNGEAGFADGVGSAASFNFPLGLRYGPDGNLYVADSYNRRIRKIQLVEEDAGLTVSDPAKPSDTSGAFSPNGDDTKDTLDLHVKAKTAWRITTIDAAGSEVTVKEGAGSPEPLTLNWDGRVNGITLPDGKYTLRLKAGSEEKTVEVVVDTTKPTITQTQVAGYNEDDLGSVSYTFAAKASDPEVNNSRSDIDEKTLKATYENADFSDALNSKKVADGEYEFSADLSHADKKAKELRYKVHITDNAGNTSLPFTGSYSTTSDVSSTAALDTDSIADAGSPSLGYHLQAVRKPINEINSGDVFYQKSDTRARLTAYYITHDFNIWRPAKGTRYIYIIDSAGNRVAKSKFNWVSNTLVEAAIKWDGRNESGAYVPKGRYKAIISEAPPWEKRTRVVNAFQEFKVSDKECIKISEWQSQRAAYQITDQKAHVLDRHIVDLPGGSPDRFFGTYDPTLAITPRPTGYNEQSDKPGYAITLGILRQPQFFARYDTVMRFARSVWFSPKSTVGDTVSKYAPLVLRNGRVIWVRTVTDPAYSTLDPITRLREPSVKTVYPYYLLQSQYEQNL